MEIYTKTGDSGETSLVGGVRVVKSDIRVCAYGDIDELISHFGLLRCKITETKDCYPSSLLRNIQENLMLASAHVASLEEVSKFKHFDELNIAHLEGAIDRMSSLMPPQKAFILPAQPEGASLCHIARTVCRRAERSVIALNDSRVEIAIIVKYLNRLSDFLFILGRFQCYVNNISEDYWQP